MALALGGSGQGIVSLLLVEVRHQLAGGVYPAHQLGKSIPKQTGDAQGHINSRAPQ